MKKARVFIVSIHFIFTLSFVGTQRTFYDSRVNRHYSVLLL